jgi:1,4-dihydroxy-2-naphthoate octaprenyltransferase
MTDPARSDHQVRTVVWWRAVRFHFVPPSFLPAVLGGAAAWALAGSFLPVLFLVTVVCVTLNHLALNMTDDYFDYLHAVDGSDVSQASLYSGGSGTLTSGLISPKKMLTVIILLYGATLAGLAYAAIERGWPVLVFGFVGVFSSVFYTAPPLKYAYRGFGEASQLINFSLVLGLGSYYVQAGRIGWEPALLVLPLGLMMFSMIVANEIPDAREDRAGGKLTLVVRLGTRRSLWLYAGGMLGAYLVLASGALSGMFSVWALAPLVTVPLFLSALGVFRRNMDNLCGAARANLLTIRVHNLTGIILTGVYLGLGLERWGLRGDSLWGFVLPAAALAVLYAPAALVIFPPSSLATLVSGKRTA